MMPSIDDWAAKAARHIRDEIRGRHMPTEDRIAAIIATYAAPLLTLVNASRREHDSGYLAAGDPCAKVQIRPAPDAVCDCGADAWNARIDKALSGQ